MGRRMFMALGLRARLAATSSVGAGGRVTPLLPLLFLVVGLAGCLDANERAADAADGADGAACVHPFPCLDGRHWPQGLAGPFELLEAVDLMIPSHDGVELHGWLWRPDLPDGVGAPTVLVSNPYLWDVQASSMGRHQDAARNLWIPQGYALLVVEVRGTGLSGGCFDHHGMPSQLDPAALVDWVAGQPWSNGRVGMQGISYLGVTAIHGALHAGEALKAVVAAAVPQQYLYHHTPQGAFATSATAYEATQHTVHTPPVATGLLAAQPGQAEVLTQRACEALVRNAVAEPMGQWTDDRDPEFWGTRNMYLGYPNVTAAMLLAEGFEDPYIRWGQEVAWQLLDGPKRVMFGQWGHDFPTREDWAGLRLAWFDYWLKGIGDAPGVGIADYQTDDGVWHASTSWPPADANPEVLYLNQDRLHPAPAAGKAGFQTSPALGLAAPSDLICSGVAAQQGLAYVSQPLAEPTVVAGNPHAVLRLSSDQPGGLAGFYLYRLASGDCADAHLLSMGAVDLRFHQGNLIGRDFPVATPSTVRVDFEPVAASLAAGDRIGLVVADAGPYHERDLQDSQRLAPNGPSTDGRAGQPYWPYITVHGGDGPEASRLVLPFAAGTLGGATAVEGDPPRPFLPNPKS